MTKLNNIKGKEYIPEDPLVFLKNYEVPENFKEVLYTFGDEEIMKEDGKYYLSHTVYPWRKKEITRETAAEMWQVYNKKERDNVNPNFDL